MIMARLAAVVFAIAASAPISPAAAAGDMMRISGTTSPPIGHVQFCRQTPEECDGYDRPSRIVRMTDAVWDRLSRLNRAVNTEILPATDLEIHGVAERWSYPGILGDCEDYVLEKRHRLIGQGWPASALLITVVKDEAGDGHAVLTVRTDRGDYILDNKTDDILLWDMTPYTFIKRQSDRHAAAWFAIEDGRAVAVGSLRR